MKKLSKLLAVTVILSIILASCAKDPVEYKWKVDNYTSEDFTVVVDGAEYYLGAYEDVSGRFEEGECKDIDVYDGYSSAFNPGTYIKGEFTCNNTTIDIRNSDLGGSGGGSGGYNCISGDCLYSSSGGSYSTLTSCQFSCGGGGGSGYGDVTFWTDSDLGCGNITVYVNGYSGTISSYYSGGLSYCDASGCANFYLPAGTYNYSASCASGTWSGSVTVAEDGCFRMQLTL